MQVDSNLSTTADLSVSLGTFPTPGKQALPNITVAMPSFDLIFHFGRLLGSQQVRLGAVLPDHRSPSARFP